MHVLVRTYAHSKKASFVSIAGTVIALILFIMALLSLLSCFKLEELNFGAASLAGIGAGFGSLRGSRRLAEHLALHDLEKRLGRPILENR